MFSASKRVVLSKRFAFHSELVIRSAGRAIGTREERSYSIQNPASGKTFPNASIASSIFAKTKDWNVSVLPLDNG